MRTWTRRIFAMGLAFLLALPAVSWAEETIEPGVEYAMKTTFRKVIPAIGNFRVMQGGCVSEQYVWFALVKVDTGIFDVNRECIIIKYDRETMKEVGRSEPLLLNHANDITYRAETNELYVIHAFRDLVSVIDADTLTVKEVKTVRNISGYGLDYCPERELFVIALGKCDVGYFDSTLEKVKGCAFTENTTLITQGICAEEKYIYHVLYSQNNQTEPDNMVWIIDWDGNIVAKLPIDTWSYEPENISLVGDTFYIGCNSGSGGVMFTAKLEKIEPEKTENQ